MKHLIYLGILSVSLFACNQEGKNTESTDTSVSNDLIDNPATAENPTAKPKAFAVMSFKSKEFDFGDILEGQKVVTTYEFTNTGKVDLLINNCEAACGCTVPEWPRTPVKPGESGIIKVIFDSAGKSGMNTKLVTVHANVEEERIELKFTANVRALKQNTNQ